MRLRFGGGLPGTRYTRVFPFKRNPWAIGIVAALDLVFLLPAAGVFQQAASAWATSDQLFDLVMALFLSGWLLGWSLAPLVLTLLLLVLVFGREVLSADRDRISILMGVPLLGVQMDFEPSRLRNLRIEQPPAKSGKSWRGSHLAFDYGSHSMALGSDIPEAALAPLTR